MCVMKYIRQGFQHRYKTVGSKVNKIQPSRPENFLAVKRKTFLCFHYLMLDYVFHCLVYVAITNTSFDARSSIKDKENKMRYLCNPASTQSAHFLRDLEGTVAHLSLLGVVDSVNRVCRTSRRRLV